MKFSFAESHSCGDGLYGTSKAARLAALCTCRLLTQRKQQEVIELALFTEKF